MLYSRKHLNYQKVSMAKKLEIEKDLEKTVPKGLKKIIQRNYLLYTGSFAMIIIIIGALSWMLYNLSVSLKEQRDTVAGLNIDLKKKENELTALTSSLSKTEEGKKQLEATKSAVDDQNKQLDARATSAEQTAYKAKSDLASTQATLSSTQATLAQTQTTLDKARRGVAMFDQAKSIFDLYDQASGNFVNHLGNAWQAINNKDFSTYNYYDNLMATDIANTKTYYSQINSIFNSIKSGNY